MLVYPHIDPFVFNFGGFSLKWYSLMYLIGFLSFYFLVRKKIKSSANFIKMSEIELGDLLAANIIGVIIGGRIGYVLFYNLEYYLANPTAIYKIWQGGMSFHGGLFGVLVATILLSRRYKRNWLEYFDFCGIYTTIGLCAGRIGNFINGELWGRVTSSDLPWSMVFSHVDQLPRHPSQLYQAILEGPVLFLLVLIVARRTNKRGLVAVCFVAFYGALRFLVEFFRQPDAQIGFDVLGLSRGQLLSLAMITAAIIYYKVWLAKLAPYAQITEAPQAESGSTR